MARPRFRTFRRVAAVIPAWNEGRHIAKVVRHAKARPEIDRVIVVDDCSTDETGSAARRAGALVVRHGRNRGAGAAIRSGMFAAAKRGFDVALVMGADDQDPAHEIPRLLRALDADRDFVQGSRWLSRGRVVNIPLFRRVTTIVYSLIFTVLTRRRITDGTNGFRAIRLSILPRINLNQAWLERYELEPYLYWHVVQDGFRWCETPVTKRYPKSGEGYTKMKGLADWWRILRPLVFLGLRLKR